MKIKISKKGVLFWIIILLQLVQVFLIISKKKEKQIYPKISNKMIMTFVALCILSFSVLFSKLIFKSNELTWLSIILSLIVSQMIIYHIF